MQAEGAEKPLGTEAEDPQVTETGEAPLGAGLSGMGLGEPPPTVPEIPAWVEATVTTT